VVAERQGSNSSTRLTGQNKINCVIYVLHAFQKKSKKGIATPKAELDKIKRRLKEAEQASLESDR